MSSGAPSSNGVEQAVNAVRAILASVGVVTLLTFEATRSRSDFGQMVAVVAAIGFATLLLSWLGQRLGTASGSARRTWKLLLLHGIDTVAVVGLAVAMEVHVSQASWALLVVPIVVASIRLDDLAVVGTWVICSAGYTLAGRVNPALGAADWGLLVERVAVMLAVAASVALLARWLQEGWRAQGELTAESESRLARVSTIEHASRAMRAVELDQIIETCVAHIPTLGFVAATATVDGVMVAAAGDAEIVPIDTPLDTPESDDVLVTHWLGAEKHGVHGVHDAHSVHSASVVGPVPGSILTGWSKEPVEPPAAEALCDLAANAENAMAAARHLAQARFQATHDPLTRLANRAELQRQLTVAARQDELMAVLFIDLDRFKDINDSHGHLVADQVLVALANRLQAALNGQGLVARFGGDEFVVLVTGGLATVAAELGEHIQNAFREPIAVAERRIQVGMSIGVAADMRPVDVNELLALADGAAYSAKRAGRDRVHVADSGHRFAVIETRAG
ncbi:MAG: GGDEF domain-containing protein [Acidimicrobiales bacterium]